MIIRVAHLPLTITLPRESHAELAALQDKLKLKRSAIIRIAIHKYAQENRVDVSSGLKWDAPWLEQKE